MSYSYLVYVWTILLAGWANQTVCSAKNCWMAFSDAFELPSTSRHCAFGASAQIFRATLGGCNASLPGSTSIGALMRVSATSLMEKQVCCQGQMPSRKSTISAMYVSRP